MRFTLSGLFILILLTMGCKKDPDPNPSTNGTNDTLLYGLWIHELAIRTEYDSLNNITNVDTVTFTNATGDPVTYYEEYTRGSEFRIIVDLTDTIRHYIFHKNGNNITIDVADSNYFFNNRTITTLNDSVLSVFEIYSLNPKEKWEQTFRRL